MRPVPAPPDAPWSAAERLGLVLWAEVTFVVLVALATGVPPAPITAVVFALALAVLLAVSEARRAPATRRRRSMVSRRRRWR